MVQSFSLVNVIPQNTQHNSGAWFKIEQDTWHYVRRANGDMFVITGPVFAEDASQIGANRVRVPAFLYKLVYAATTHRVLAHWQQNREGETVSRPVGYQELVKRTDIEFFLGIPVQHCANSLDDDLAVIWYRIGIS